MSRVTLRIVGRLLFGADVERAVPVVAHAFPVLGEYARLRSYNPFPLPRAWPLPANRRARARAGRGPRRVRRHDRRAPRVAGAAGDDLLSLLIAARDGDEALDDAEIRDQVLIFLLAGHDTTAIALTFALHLLGHHPEAQERVRAEVADVAGDRTPGAADVERLAYTTMVLKEAMRLYPPAWALRPPHRRRPTRSADTRCRPPARRDREPVGHPSPSRTSGTTPSASTRSASRRSAEAARHRHAYFPFGAGPRACIGQYFSMLEAAILLAVIVRDHELDEPRRPRPARPADHAAPRRAGAQPDRTRSLGFRAVLSESYKVLVAEQIADSGVDLLRERFEVDVGVGWSAR